MNVAATTVFKVYHLRSEPGKKPRSEYDFFVPIAKHKTSTFPLLYECHGID